MLQLTGISKSFPGFALKDITFRIGKGDYFILLGESGAGKSMVLEMIAGLMHPDTGSICLREQDISRLKIQERKIGLVFQDYAVFPHMTVAQNIGYALHSWGLTKVEKHGKITRIAGKLGISDLLDRSPATLSGGELQRVALGRSLVQEPELLLLDEPLASLDSRLRDDLRRLLRQLNNAGLTILHVTHDYEEALSLATRIAVLDKGSIIQTGTPDEVFHHPANEFIARFVGVRNFFSVKFSAENIATFAIIKEDLRLKLGSQSTENEGFISIRGEDITISAGPVETSAANSLHGTITEIVPTRAGLDVTIDTGIEFHALVTGESMERLGLQTGDACWIHIKATSIKPVH